MAGIRDIAVRGDGRGVLLLSGGMDSTVLLAALRREGWQVHALTVTYGQRHDVEIGAARRQAQAWRCAAHEVLDLPDGLFRSALVDGEAEIPRDREVMDGVPATYVPARNLVLLSLAAAWAESRSLAHVFIAVNAVDTSGYPDCRGEFIEAFDAALRTGTRDGIRVTAPLLDMSKADIVRLGRELEVDLASTVSCYDPDGEGRACGRCDACLLRRRGFVQAGIADPTRYVEA